MQIFFREERGIRVMRNTVDLRCEAENLLDVLDKTAKGLSGELYYAIKKKRVKEDVLTRFRDNDHGVWKLKVRELIADSVAERYVYEGDYECNLSYWDNLDNLIDEEKINLGAA